MKIISRKVDNYAFEWVSEDVEIYQDEWGYYIIMPDHDVLVVGIWKELEFVPGDANHDGKADSSDAVAILRNLAGYEVPDFYADTADINGDGLTDSSDAVAILRKLAGY